MRLRRAALRRRRCGPSSRRTIWPRRWRISAAGTGGSGWRRSRSRRRGAEGAAVLSGQRRLGTRLLPRPFRRSAALSPSDPALKPRQARADTHTRPLSNRVSFMLTIARVLLAGGDEQSLIGLQQALESAGHDVSRAPTLEEATRRVQAVEVDVARAQRRAGAVARAARAARGAASRPRSWSWRIVRPCRRVRDALRAAARATWWTRRQRTHVVLVAVERAARDGAASARARDAARARRRRVAAARWSAGRRRWRMCASSSDAPRDRACRSLITGEPGTGKDVVARLVHDLSERASRPYATVRCGEADRGGARARAVRGDGDVDASRAGLLERVRGGTVVLEDASSLPPALRAQLSRVAPHAH